MKFLFYFSVLFILYTYAGYPCILFILSRLFHKRVRKGTIIPEPTVSVVISVLNEEKNIKRRIDNLFEQDYPPEKMEIIVVSDGSTDNTINIVNKLVSGEETKAAGGRENLPKLKLIEINEKMGKPNALNTGLGQAEGEYIVFTDSRQEFRPDAIRELIGNFNDPKVGCVSGKLVFHEDSDTKIKAEMSFYWNMEKWIRNTESDIHSVAGATGAIYAIRKSLFRTIPRETILDDVFVPMRIVEQGYRVVFDNQAVAYDTISIDMSQEKRRKVRTLLGNYQLLQIMPELLSPVKNPIWFGFLSHKIFRLFIPFFFLSLVVSSLMAEGLIPHLCFAVIMVLLILSIFDKAVSSIPCLGRLSSLSRTFLSLNYFAVLAFFQFIKPGKKDVW